MITDSDHTTDTHDPPDHDAHADAGFDEASREHGASSQADDATSWGSWAPPQEPPPTPARPDGGSRNLAAVSHLSAFVLFAGIPSFIGPLAIWLLFRDRDAFVADQAREALNFNVSLLLYAAAALAMSLVTFGLALVVVVPVGVAAALVALVLPVLAAVRTADGEPYRYPLTLRLIA